MNIPDSIQEWWTYPLASRVGTRTVLGAISSTGEVLACSLDHTTGITGRHVVGTAPADDHNTPALHPAVEGRRMLMVWSQHGAENVIHLKVSDQARDVASLVAAPAVTADVGGPVSYQQVFRITHLCTPTVDTFWVLTRVTSYVWTVTTVVVAQDTGAITVGATQPLVTASDLTYLSCASAHNSGAEVIRVAWGYNPGASKSAVRYFEINVETGAVTSPIDPGVNANLDGTNLPLVDTAVAPLLPDRPAGSSRRLLYARPGPSSPGVAYAEWDSTTPDSATYHVVTIEGGGTSTSSYGTAGPRVGYTAAANYIPGMAFPDPCPAGEVYVARRDATTGKSTVEHYRDGTPEILAASYTTRLIRPVPVRDSTRVLVSDVTDYAADSYTAFLASVMTVGLDGIREPLYLMRR